MGGAPGHEHASNRLYAVFEVTDRRWPLAIGLEFLDIAPTVTPAREDLEMARQTEETLN